MKPIFERYAYRLNPDEIITSAECPLKGFEAVPKSVTEFYAALKKQQGELGRVVTGGFWHGSAIPDTAEGKHPKDFDLYVCAPDFMKAFVAASATPEEGSKMSLFRRAERLEMAMGPNFPIYTMEDLPVAHNNQLFGDYVETNGLYHMESGKHVNIDLRIGSKPLTMQQHLMWVHAPVMAIAVSLEEDHTFAYHKDMPEHRERGLMRIAGEVPPILKRKAARKGMTIEQLPPPPPP